MADELKGDVLALKEELIALRRDFHMYPELGMRETRTAEKVKAYLNDLGLDVTTGIGQTGVVGLIEGNGPGKTLMLRADMDALPIQEKTDVAYRSKNDGIMHACGHDGHTAILLGVAKLLYTRRNDFSGNIKLVFQPGEEGYAGAFFMMHDGVLENPTVDAALGLHLFTTFPLGLISVREGAVMSSADLFSLTIKGRGGHGAHPEGGVDAILIAGHVITSLQSLISREISAQAAAVVHIGKIQGGTAENIIADQVVLSGSVRTLDEKIRTLIADRMDQILKGIISAFRGSYTLNYTRGYPGLINETVMTELVGKAAVKTVGPENVIEAIPLMGSEDMAFFLEKVPGCFFFVGAANPDKGFSHPHHHELFNFDEDALVIGAETLLRAALDYLKTA